MILIFIISYPDVCSGENGRLSQLLHCRLAYMGHIMLGGGAHFVLHFYKNHLF